MPRILGALALVGLALATVPLLGLPAFYETFLYLVFHWIVLATSWNILSGYSGYFSFGHGAFFGAGMYATATLTTKANWPFLATLPMAAIVAGGLGLALGAVVFRQREVREELFALLTLAVTFVLATIILNTPLDGGPGVVLSAVRVPALWGTVASSFYLMALALAIATLAIAAAIARSRLGRGLFAIRDDERAAEVMGVPTWRCKMIAFGVSCALAGVAGGIHALFVSYVTVAETFSIAVPLTVVLMSVLGGTRHWAGPAVGAAIITTLSYASTAGDYALAGKAAIGVILILVIVFMPDGILGTGAARRALARRIRQTLPIRDRSLIAVARGPEGARAKHPSIGSLLVLRDVGKSFEGVEALAGVDLDVVAGEVLGLLGPNGSGKSTLINVISGHHRADHGRIVFDGHDLTTWDAHRIAGIGIARTYQIPRPFAHLPVLENAMLPALFGRTGFDRRMAEREAMGWLEFTGLADKAAAMPSELNLHERKSLELARALSARPRLLLLDEVLSGLAPLEFESAIDTVRRIRDRGTSIVLVEHVVRVVMALADRVVVLNHGRVIADGNPYAVMADPAVIAAYIGRPHDALD